MDQREGITLVDRTLMRRGEVFLALGKPAEAVKAYEQYAAKAWEVWNFTALTEVYARIVALYEQTRKYDLFFINVERYRSIAVRAGRKDDEGLAMEAQARGLLREFRYRTALHMYERILDHWVGIKDEPGRARALRGMETCWVELKDVQKAKEFGKACGMGVVVVVVVATDSVRCPSPSLPGDAARVVEEHMPAIISQSFDYLKRFQSTLVAATLRMASTIELERVSVLMPWARDERVKLIKLIEESGTKQLKLHEAIEEQETRLVSVGLRRASGCGCRRNSRCSCRTFWRMRSSVPRAPRRSTLTQRPSMGHTNGSQYPCLWKPPIERWGRIPRRCVAAGALGFGGWWGRSHDCPPTTA